MSEERSSNMRQEFWDLIQKHNSTMLEPDKLDEAIVSVSYSGNILYSYDKLVEVFARDEGMSEEDAIEWIEFNTVRAIPYMPEPRPVLLRTNPWDS